MAEYDNTNSGAMFFEDDKQSERHPDYKGSINVDGKDYWLSAWDKVSKSGKNYISISIKIKEAKSGKDSSSWQQARDKFKKGDQIGTVGVGAIFEGNIDNDEPINLDDIPF